MTESKKDYWKRWAKAAVLRALRTFVQTAASLMGTAQIGITELDWPGIVSVSATAAAVSLLMSLGGLPEVSEAIPQPELFEDGEVVENGDQL